MTETATRARRESRKRAWREAARAVKQAFLGNSQSALGGRDFWVLPMARGFREDRDYAMLAALARGRSSTWDVGANLGYTSLLMASAMESAPTAEASLVAFEASELACRAISRHAAMNELDGRIAVVNAVVGERSGEAVDFFWDHASGGASTIEGYLDHRRAITKTSIALDDYLASRGRPPELIKMDIEGAEASALRGAGTVLREHRPWVVVELHSWQGTSLEENAATILAWLPEVGYEMVYLRTRAVVAEASALAGRGRCHVLLLPEGQAVPDALADVDTSSL